MRAPSALRIKIKVSFLAVVLFFTSLMPQKSYAILGVGDISFDPAVLAGMLGQTGAQIAQMVQTYYLFVEMRDRLGTIKNFKDWKGLSRRLLKKECENLTRRVLYDIRKRGARISSETPTNPVLAAMITGRRRMNDMSNRVSSGTFLADQYSASQWSIAAKERELQKQRQQAAREQAAAQADASKGGKAIGLDSRAYASNPDGSAPPPVADGDKEGDLKFTPTPTLPGTTGAGSSGTSSTSSNQGTVPATSSSSSSSGGSTTSSGASFASGREKSLAPEDANLEAARDAVKDDGVNLPGIVNPVDPQTGKVITDSDTANKTASVRSRAMLQEAAELLDAGVLQEYDAADSFISGAQENLAAAQEALDETDQHGPEPFLQHMIAQNDTIIGMYSFTFRAERMKEEAAQLRREIEARKNDSDYRHIGIYTEGVKAAQGAGRF